MVQAIMHANSNHYSVLWLIHNAQYQCTFDMIVRYSGLDCVTARRILRDLTNDEFCEGCAWIISVKGVYKVGGVHRDGEASTGGFRALEESAYAPDLAMINSSVWVDEALTGISRDGNRTRIDNAVIPRCMRKK